MISRIDNLLNDWRLDYLGQEKEFRGIKGKLTDIRKRLFAGKECRNGEESLINKVEVHICNISPHKKVGWIDGEPNQEYWVITGMDK